MGVVRREGAWRLEKREEGLYEVTYNQEPQAKVVTPRYSSGVMDDGEMSLLPVHEVGSYAEVEGAFDEYAHSGQPTGMTSTNIDSTLGIGPGVGGDRSPVSGGNHTRRDGEGDILENIGDLPPGGIALICLLVGGVVLYITGFAPGQLVFLVGILFSVVGIGIFAWAGALSRIYDWDAAVEFLVTVEEESSSPDSSNKNEEVSKTPPVPEKLKNELIFGRADQTCEWCGTHPLDHPEVHHIQPRSNGGSNDPKNLIVLCPTCHRKADEGGITKTKLRGKMRHIRSEQS